MNTEDLEKRAFRVANIMTIAVHVLYISKIPFVITVTAGLNFAFAKLVKTKTTTIMKSLRK